MGLKYIHCQSRRPHIGSHYSNGVTHTFYKKIALALAHNQRYSLIKLNEVANQWLHVLGNYEQVSALFTVPMDVRRRLETFCDAFDCLCVMIDNLFPCLH